MGDLFKRTHALTADSVSGMASTATAEPMAQRFEKKETEGQGDPDGTSPEDANQADQMAVKRKQDGLSTGEKAYVASAKAYRSGKAADHREASVIHAEAAANMMEKSAMEVEHSSMAKKHASCAGDSVSAFNQNHDDRGKFGSGGGPGGKVRPEIATHRAAAADAEHMATTKQPNTDARKAYELGGKAHRASEKAYSTGSKEDHQAAADAHAAASVAHDNRGNTSKASEHAAHAADHKNLLRFA